MKAQYIYKQKRQRITKYLLIEKRPTKKIKEDFTEWVKKLYR